MPDSKTNTGVASESFLLVVANNEAVVCQLGSALFSNTAFASTQPYSTVLQFFAIQLLPVCIAKLALAWLT